METALRSERAWAILVGVAITLAAIVFLLIPFDVPGVSQEECRGPVVELVAPSDDFFEKCPEAAQNRAVAGGGAALAGLVLAGVGAWVFRS